MLGILVISYNLDDFIYQSSVLKDLKDDTTIIFVTNNEDKLKVNDIKSNIDFDIYHLDVNLGHHDGAFSMVCSAKDLFDNCDYICCYTADHRFDDINILNEIYNNSKEFKISSLPRHWLVNNDGSIIERPEMAITFHPSFYLMESSLFKKVYTMDNLDKYKDRYDEHYESVMYKILIDLNVDMNKDILYLEDIKELKDRFNNQPAYYNFKFINTGIVHYDSRNIINV